MKSSWKTCRSWVLVPHCAHIEKQNNQTGSWVYWSKGFRNSRSAFLSITDMKWVGKKHREVANLVCNDVQLYDTSRSGSGLLADNIKHFAHQFLNKTQIVFCQFYTMSKTDKGTFLMNLKTNSAVYCVWKVNGVLAMNSNRAPWEHMTSWCWTWKPRYIIFRDLEHYNILHSSHIISFAVMSLCVGALTEVSGSDSSSSSFLASTTAW